MFRDRLRAYDRTLSAQVDTFDGKKKHELVLSCLKEGDLRLRRLVNAFQSLMVGDSTDSFEQRTPSELYADLISATQRCQDITRSLNHALRDISEGSDAGEACAYQQFQQSVHKVLSEINDQGIFSTGKGSKEATW